MTAPLDDPLGLRRIAESLKWDETAPLPSWLDGTDLDEESPPLPAPAPAAPLPVEETGPGLQRVSRDAIRALRSQHEDEDADLADLRPVSLEAISFADMDLMPARKPTPPPPAPPPPPLPPRVETPVIRLPDPAPVPAFVAGPVIAPKPTTLPPLPPSVAAPAPIVPVDDFDASFSFVSIDALAAEFAPKPPAPPVSPEPPVLAPEPQPFVAEVAPPPVEAEPIAEPIAEAPPAPEPVPIALPRRRDLSDAEWRDARECLVFALGDRRWALPLGAIARVRVVPVDDASHAIDPFPTLEGRARVAVPDRVALVDTDSDLTLAFDRVVGLRSLAWQPRTAHDSEAPAWELARAGAVALLDPVALTGLRSIP